jgi:hypothetical protein
VGYLVFQHRMTDAPVDVRSGPVHRVRLQDPVTATLEQAKVETVQMQMQRVASALEMRYAVDGSYPTALDVLVEENMLSNARALEDPWGRRLQYRLTVADGQEWRLCSMGPDRRAGTADDVCHAD